MTAVRLLRPIIGGGNAFSFSTFCVRQCSYYLAYFTIRARGLNEAFANNLQENGGKTWEKDEIINSYFLFTGYLFIYKHMDLLTIVRL